MPFELKTFKTLSDGSGTSPVAAGDILYGISIEETVGDENFIKAGDLEIQTISLIAYDSNPAWRNWIALYLNDTLLNIYLNENVYSMNETPTKIYSYRLKPIQMVFYNDLSGQVMFDDSANTNMWNSVIEDAAMNIYQITIDNHQSALHRYGFSVGDLLSSLSGKDNNLGYTLDSISHPLPTVSDSDDEILYLFRGLSIDNYNPEPISDAIEWTFENSNYETSVPSQEWKIYWMDIFQIAAFAFNAFIKVTPNLTLSPSTELGIDIEITPKIEVSPTSPETKTWLSNRIYERGRYQIDQVILSGINFRHVLSKNGGGKKYEKTLNIADYEIAGITAETVDVTLYWGKGEYDGTEVNDLVTYLQGEPYFKSGLVQPYYADMLTDGHGYEGEILYNGEKVLDEVLIDSTVFRILKIRLKNEFVAQIEGIVIDESYTP